MKKLLIFIILLILSFSTILAQTKGQVASIYNVTSSRVAKYNENTQKWTVTNTYHPEDMSLIINGYDITVNAKTPMYLRLVTKKPITYKSGNPVLNYYGIMNGKDVDVAIYVDNGLITNVSIFQTIDDIYWVLDYSIE